MGTVAFVFAIIALAAAGTAKAEVRALRREVEDLRGGSPKP